MTAAYVFSTLACGAPDCPGTAPVSGWSRAACIGAGATHCTVDLFTGSSTGDVLLPIHERDDDGAHLVEAAIRLDPRAVRALILLLERAVAR